MVEEWCGEVYFHQGKDGCWHAIIWLKTQTQIYAQGKKAHILEIDNHKTLGKDVYCEQGEDGCCWIKRPMCHNLAPKRPDQPIHPAYFPAGSPFVIICSKHSLKLKSRQTPVPFLQILQSTSSPEIVDHIRYELVLIIKLNEYRITEYKYNKY